MYPSRCERKRVIAVLVLTTHVRNRERARQKKKYTQLIWAKTSSTANKFRFYFLAIFLSWRRKWAIRFLAYDFTIYSICFLLPFLSFSCSLPDLYVSGCKACFRIKAIFDRRDFFGSSAKIDASLFSSNFQFGLDLRRNYNFDSHQLRWKIILPDQNGSAEVLVRTLWTASLLKEIILDLPTIPNSPKWTDSKNPIDKISISRKLHDHTVNSA